MLISMSYIMIVRFLILRSNIICHAYIKTIKLYIYIIYVCVCVK